MSANWHLHSGMGADAALTEAQRRSRELAEQGVAHVVEESVGTDSKRRIHIFRAETQHLRPDGWTYTVLWRFPEEVA